MTPAKIGIVYPLSGIERLVRLAGPGAAKYLLFSGDFVPAEQALRLGLVERVIPQADFWTDVASFARRLAGRSQLSLQAMKELVDTIAAGGQGAGGRDAVELTSRRWQQEMAAAADPVIGVRAFLAKEEPVFTWTGRDRTAWDSTPQGSTRQNGSLTDNATQEEAP
ncbi:enoyl-CoA hydratase-related protein [Arthrobacter sp. ATA002]|uniref:enoyl-CoA hydratase/isomerase family protein n=1 Tax=Arthrobacter sp. ATA002 TaxID=2991715 RepID=UPI0022A6AA51|nr:enoyl-CoA hydratase-related protein [Arthrobacter sp. ATA002]WAP53359.1 enoyl-CoA hydratase-related protein [Arthrobacter sp. ATA002]